MSAFRVIEWRDSSAQGGDREWYEQTFKQAAQNMWLRRGIQADRPIYRVCNDYNAAAFRQFVINQCKLHRRDGEMLGVICHGNNKGMMAYTQARDDEILSYSDFWEAVEKGFGNIKYQTLIFASCEAMAVPDVHIGCAPYALDTVVGYSGSPQGIYAVRLLASIFALSCEGFDAARLALEDGGSSRQCLKENFDIVQEFLATRAISPYRNDGFRPDPDDPKAGEILVLQRTWQPARKIEII